MEEFRRVNLYRMKDGVKGGFARSEKTQFDQIDVPEAEASILVTYEDAHGKPRTDAAVVTTDSTDCALSV